MDEIVCEETKILEEVIPQMFEVMQRVAQFSCDYIKYGRFGRQSFLRRASADDCSENSRWAGPPRDDRGNG